MIPLRLITWNCHHGGIPQRCSLLEHYNADIIVLQEVQAPSTSCPNVQWFGKNKKKGHAIIVSKNFSISLFDIDKFDPFVVPLKIEGKFSMHVLLVWTQKHGDYIMELEEPIRKYRDFLLEKPSVVIGDFNSNAIWDKNHRFFNHSRMVSLLKDSYGLVSAYHERMNCRHGAERHPTLFHCFKPERKYHIDYCFIPDVWKISNVIVGEFSEWISESDHCPVIIDVEIENIR